MNGSGEEAGCEPGSHGPRGARDNQCKTQLKEVGGSDDLGIAILASPLDTCNRRLLSIPEHDRN